MNGIERQYLREAIQALCNARNSLLSLDVRSATEKPPFGKTDSLGLDVYPEIAIIQSLCEDFDPHLVVVTEESGINLKLGTTEEKFVCFCDPMDRSSVLNDFLKDKEGSIYEIFQTTGTREEWESKYGGDIEISGPYGSITIIRDREILFNAMINYMTGTIYVACEAVVGYLHHDDLFEDAQKSVSQHPLLRRTRFLLQGVREFNFYDEIDYANKKKSVAYCKGQVYENNLLASKIFRGTTIDDIKKNELQYIEPGGPARILYLKDPAKVGFILSNGEKIGEWLGWLAYVKYAWPELRAYEVAFESAWTKEQILMAPGPAYSIIDGEKFKTSGGRTCKYLEINIEKLKYFSNPSLYRSTIIVCPSYNTDIDLKLAVRECSELRFKHE